MRTGKWLTPLITAGLLALLAVGIPNSFLNVVAAQGEANMEMEAIHIHMGEFMFQVEGAPDGAPIELQAGKMYELVFHVDGAIPHEAMIGDPAELMTEDGMPHGYGKNLFEGMELKIKGEMINNEFEIEVMGLMELELNKEQLLSVEFTLPENAKGEWEIGCFVAGHYEAGMKLPLIVK